MPSKSYKTPKKTPLTANEPVMAYQLQPATSKVLPSTKWNPNVPFHGTQDEWWDHFHRIEEGEFTSLEEADKEFEAWKKEYLASKLM